MSDHIATIRRFQHIEGFKDDVDYIEYYEDTSIVFVLENGDKILGRKVDVSEFEVLVQKGVWKELDSFKIYPNTKSNIFKDLF